MVVALLGLVLLFFGGASFFWSAPNMDMIRSPGGQLAMGLNSLFNSGAAARNEQQVQMYQIAYYGGIVFMVLGGVLVIAGLVTRVNRRSAGVRPLDSPAPSGPQGQ